MLLLLVTGGVLFALVLTGCGGGDGAATTGTVTGWVVDVDSGLGIGGLTVLIGGQSGESTVPDGDFTVRRIPPGTHVVTVVPTAAFEMVPGPPVTVPVVAGATTALPAPVLVIDPASLPPEP